MSLPIRSITFSKGKVAIKSIQELQHIKTSNTTIRKAFQRKKQIADIFAFTFKNEDMTLINNLKVKIKGVCDFSLKKVYLDTGAELDAPRSMFGDLCNHGEKFNVLGTKKLFSYSGEGKVVTVDGFVQSHKDAKLTITDVVGSAWAKNNSHQEITSVGMSAYANDNASQRIELVAKNATARDASHQTISIVDGSALKEPNATQKIGYVGDPIID